MWLICRFVIYFSSQCRRLMILFADLAGCYASLLPVTGGETAGGDMGGASSNAERTDVKEGN